MIITRTPYRVSFFGGGTDLPKWYEQHGGAVLTSTINKYCYVLARPMPAFLGTKYRVFWSKMETVDRVEDIEHPAVRAALQYVGYDGPFEVNHAGDLPARSGLGSSSAFSVGMLHALYALKGYPVILSKSALAASAVDLEQRHMRENVGIQDQIECAHGGLNRIDIERSGHWTVSPVEVSPERMDALEARLMLFYTGLQRSASAIQASTLSAMQQNERSLHGIRRLVDESVEILCTSRQLDEFGELLHEGWALKQRLSPYICTPEIYDLYEAARHAGALGGKLLGAGGGGFLLLYADPERQASVRAALPGLLEVPFKFENEGTRLILS